MQCVTLDNLSIGYKRKVVLSGINASVSAGQLTCLIGSNGVGKSTLLRTLAHFQPALEGHIYIKGVDISTLTPKELARIIGVVLTDKPNIVGMTTEEMVLTGRAPYTGFWGNNGDDDRQIALEALETVGVTDLRHRQLSTLSDGERQKVMIAKALAQQTPVLFLDEPTAFLDFPSKVETMRLLRTISREQQKTVFLSTHDLDLALQLADTVWLMDKQHGITIGTPDQLARNGTLAHFYAGRGITFDRHTGLFRVEKSE